MEGYFRPLSTFTFIYADHVEINFNKQGINSNRPVSIIFQFLVFAKDKRTSFIWFTT